MSLDTEANPRERVAWMALAGVIGIVGLIALIAWWRTPPQMGVDEHVFRTVDALYTAVRNENGSKVSQCEERLKKYREQGSLPKSAHEYLTSVIAKTKQGNWESATRQLYDFMAAQRKGA